MNQVIEAAKIVKQGGIIIFPTDTAYGIGCDMTNEKAVKRLFKIRKRPTQQATPVLFSSTEDVKNYVLPFDLTVKSLMDKFWPGALTIVLECHIDKIPFLVRGGGQTLGTRVPDNEKILKIIEYSGVPVLGPSANFHGEKTPYALEELNKSLVNMVDFVVEGEVSLKKASTVLDCSKRPWAVLREGAVHLKL